MKKTIAFGIIAIFILSLVPLGFAQAGEPSKDNAANAQNRLEDMKEKNKERLQKIAALDKAQVERLSKLDVKNIDKIVELKKERLDKLAKLSEEKMARIAEVDKDNIDKVTNLTDEELNKMAALGRARLNKLAKEDAAKLRAELKTLKVVKVKKAEDLEKRKVSEEKLAELKNAYEKSKLDFQEAKDEAKDARQKLAESKQKGDDKLTIENARNYLSKTVDNLIAHLEKIKAKIGENKNIPEDSATAVLSQIDAQISELKTMKSEIDASATKEQLKEEAKKFRDKWNSLKHLVNLYSNRVVSARVEGLVNQEAVLEKRLDGMLAKFKEKGITLDVSAEVASFSEKIALAKDKHKQAQDKLSAALGLSVKNDAANNEQIKKLVDESKELLNQARDAVKDAHEILKSIVKKLKEADPAANLSEENEVEVVEVAEEASTA